MNVNKNLVRRLIHLYANYKKIRKLSAKEYIDKINEENEIKLRMSEIYYFLEVIKHELFIQKLAKDFTKKNFLSHVNKMHVEVIIYLVIFVLENENLEILLDGFQRLNCFYLCELLATLADPSQHLFFCQIACKIFEDEYVLEKIIYPLLNKTTTLYTLAKKYDNLSTVKLKPGTKPTVLSIKDRTKKSPPPPSNTPLKHYRFRAVPAPESTKHEDNSLTKKIDKMKQENRKRAEQLLQEASKVSERLTKTRIVFMKDEKPIVIQQKTPVPVFKNVEIKGNLTTTLREASRILKNQDSEIKKIDDLLKGGFSSENIQRIQEELKKERELQELKTIEVNHLKGLVSHEDAILAKRKLLEANKEKMETFKEERIKLVEALDKWREEEEKKIKALVEKSQNSKLLVKDSERKLLERKQEQVRLQQLETKQMLDQAYEEKMKELARRAELIEEIRALDHMRFSVKEFDPTETPNFGLLCEMSLAELQERLAITKMEMQYELEKKRQNIQKEKEERRLMIEKAKNIIAQSHQTEPKSKIVLSSPVELEQSPDLLELRKLLEEKRKLRISTL